MRTVNVNVNAIGEYIRQQREQAKISLRQLADAAGVSNPYLSQIERGLRRPSAEILQQIAKGLRISAEALYIQAGILEDRPSDSGVRAAVLTDKGLTERQKQIILEIYDSFRAETAAAQQENGAKAGPAEILPEPGGDTLGIGETAQEPVLNGQPEPAPAGAGGEPVSTSPANG